MIFLKILKSKNHFSCHASLPGLHLKTKYNNDRKKEVNGSYRLSECVSIVELNRGCQAARDSFSFKLKYS